MTTHFRLVPRLRVSGAVPPLLLYRHVLRSDIYFFTGNKEHFNKEGLPQLLWYLIPW